MSFARIIKFAFFGHAAATVACYELGKHKPHGYTRPTSSSDQVKDQMKFMAKCEAIPLAYLMLVKREAALLLIAYSLPVYAYHYGRYQANLALEEASSPGIGFPLSRR